jgi:phosphatidylglycerophosphate synthase
MEKLDKQLDAANHFFRRKRDKFFLPITKIFHKLGISANTLSISKLFFACLYLLTIKNNLILAIFFLIIGGVLIDLLDGPLARYTNQASDRGKFVDSFLDQIVYALFVWGLMTINIGNPVILSFNIFAIGSLYIMMIVNKNESLESDWIITPVIRANYYKATLEISIILHLFFNMNELTFNKIIFAANILVTIHFIYHLIKFSNKKYFKNKPNTL